MTLVPMNRAARRREHAQGKAPTPAALLGQPVRRVEMLQEMAAFKQEITQLLRDDLRTHRTRLRLLELTLLRKGFITQEDWAATQAQVREQQQQKISPPSQEPGGLEPQADRPTAPHTPNPQEVVP